MGFDQLAGHIRKNLFRFLAISDIFGENQNPSYCPAGVLPWPNFPADPRRGAVCSIPAIFVCTQDLSRFESTAMHCFPRSWNIREEFVMRAPKYLRAIKSIVCTPAV